MPHYKKNSKLDKLDTIKKAQFLKALSSDIDISLIWNITGLNVGIISRWIEKDNKFLIEIMDIIW